MNYPIKLDGIIQFSSILKGDLRSSSPLHSSSITRRRPQTAFGSRERGNSKPMLWSSKASIHQERSFNLHSNKLSSSNKNMRKKSFANNSVYSKQILSMRQNNSTHIWSPSKLSYFVQAYKSNIQKKYIKIKQLKEKKGSY